LTTLESTSEMGKSLVFFTLLFQQLRIENRLIRQFFVAAQAFQHLQPGCEMLVTLLVLRQRIFNASQYNKCLGTNNGIAKRLGQLMCLPGIFYSFFECLLLIIPFSLASVDAGQSEWIARNTILMQYVFEILPRFLLISFHHSTSKVVVKFTAQVFVGR